MVVLFDLYDMLEGLNEIHRFSEPQRKFPLPHIIFQWPSPFSVLSHNDSFLLDLQQSLHL